MIILKHLTIERFRLLRAMDLHFPQRGSILIQGPNEAGKSALIESIYFALYGEPLTAKRNKRPLDDLILYGASTANVTLTLSIGATELIVARTLERGSGQSVNLQVKQPGMSDEEVITDLGEANERIINELGSVNGETLRNACLIEQKGLARLESLSGTEREAAVRKLLGLEKLEELTEQFTITAEDEQSLKESQDQLQLAEILERIPELSKQLAQIEMALDAVGICDLLEEINQQESEISELEQVLEQIDTQRLDLKGRLGRVQQLKRADATLAEIIASYDDMAEARRELPELERHIVDLERREQEELPTLEKRVNELAELTRSFGTLQRMSNDLLTAVDTIKELEGDVRQYNLAKQDLALLNEQIANTRARLAQSQQGWQELEERRRSKRPLLEARLQRLHNLAERLNVLRQLEERYTQRLVSKAEAEESVEQLKKVQSQLNDAENEMEQVESEASQAQQQAATAERAWRQISMRYKLETWQQQRALADNLALAEQHVNQARQHQSKLTQAAIEAREAARKYMMILAICGIGVVLCLIIAVVSLQSSTWLAILALVILLFAIGVGVVNFNSYRRAIEEEKSARLREQDAISRVGMMVAARENAVRTPGNQNVLPQVESEILSLGGSVPHSIEDAQQQIQQLPGRSDLGDSEQQMRVRVEAADVARSKANQVKEVVANLYAERAQLEELGKKEHWEEIEENLNADQIAVERMQQEITFLAGQEGLPIPSINARLQASPVVAADSYSSGALIPVTAEEAAGVPELEVLVDSTIKATEHEIASLTGNQDIVNDLAEQSRRHQETLDQLFVRQRAIEDRFAQYQDSSPEQQMERAREQQMALRSALQSLQDSLRQRVKPLGVAFGQAAIGNAETGARKQLEELNITLGNKIMLQEHQVRFEEVLKQRQSSLSELYKQLAKFSNTLGSWIVPLNPFAEALVSLRTRCQQELEDANEPGILQELDNLQSQEGASKLKIELCQQEILQLQEPIAAMLSQRNRPQAKSYDRIDLIAVWPLLGEYGSADRVHLEEERTALERELSELERQELQWSTSLGPDNTPLSLEQARTRKDQQERSYQTKKRGNLLVKAVVERLLRKVAPRTEYYMQQILPLLTNGRYHDVHLIAEPEEGAISGGPFQVQVWDPAANEYVHTSALSGGAADQLSLALRLAFAIAVLPRELGAAPGFVVLDEPLSSFDQGRTQALVNVVTGELLSQHYEQILLISHSSAFDPAMFPYHLYMDNGLIVESNLPVVASLTVVAIDEAEENDSAQAEPVAVGVTTDAGAVAEN